MSEAWRTFYKSVSIDARYHPELRRQFVPKRFWKNLTELQESPYTLNTSSLAGAASLPGTGRSHS